MKSIFSFSIALGMIFLYQSNLYGQGERVILGNTITLDEPPPSYFLNSDLTYRASDFINLLPNFSVKPGESCNILMESDPKMVLYDGSEYQNGGTPDNNYGGRVGKLEDNLIVTPTGALQYEVPFDLPSGVNGLTPELSLVYNSQAGDGIVGMGWSISGLSKITRTPYTYTINKYSNAVSFSNQDQLYYNGNYLVKNAEGDYYAENTDFSVIRPIDPTSLNEGFIVYKRDGKVYEYGVSENSRFYLQSLSIPLEWHIEKITDAYGNYIEFEYANDKAAGSFRPVKIRYTGNSVANVNPFYEVRFVYAQDSDKRGINDSEDRQIPYRSDTQKKYFIADESSEFKFFTRITHQLSFIELYYLPTEEKIADFQFSYSLEGELPELQLKGIYPSFWINNIVGKEQSATNEDKNLSNGLNPVKLIWDNITYQSEQIASEIDVLHTDVNTYQTTVFSANMDQTKGTDDLVQVLKNLIDNSHVIRLIQNETSTDGNGSVVQFTLKKEAELDGEFIPHLFQAVDVNGDGVDEIAVIYSNNIGTAMKVYSSYDLDVLLTKQLSNETWEDGSFFLADFTGNGLTDLIWVSKINSDACGFRFFLSESPDSPFSKIVTKSLGDVGLIKEIIVGDFAGNRRSEVILMYEVYGVKRTRIVRLTDPDNNVSFTTPNINMADIIPASGDRKVLIGDFNADAKSDILLLNNSSEDNSHFIISAGNDIFSEYTTTIDLTAINEDGEELEIIGDDIFALDINADGFTDIGLFFSEEVEEGGLSSDIIKKHYRVDHLMRLDFSNSTGVHLKYVKHQKLDQMGRGIPIDQYVTRTGTQHWLHFDMTPGNFTGFGGGQILCSRLKWTGTFSNYNLRTTITGPASYNNKSSITQIIDGLGKKRLISYSPQSVNFLEERKQMLGEAERTSKVFPVAIYKAPLNVVTEIQHESSENQYISTSYLYGQGRVHKHGKGFLGFDFILKKDLASRTATQETYVVNSQNFQVSLNNRQEWVSLSGVYKLFKNTDYTYKYVTTDLLNNKAYFPYLSNLENHFYEKEGSNTTIERKEIINYSNLDDYGNPQTILRKYLNKNNVMVSSEVKEVQYDNFVSANRRLLGLLKDEVTTYKMTGEEDVIRRTNYTNNSTTGFREIQITEPTDEKELTISYTPDAFGNVEQVTQTANGNTPRISTIEYSTDGRFPKIETNAELHTVVNQFDPKTGLLIAITDENSLSTKFTYNAFRKLLITTKHDGTQIRNNYGWLRGNGSPNQHPDTPEHGDPVYFIRTRASASPEEITFYDQHSRPVRKVEHGFNNEAIYTDFKYFNIEGKIGLLKSKTVPYFADEGQSAAFESTFDYDFKRRQIIMMNPDGSSETIVYSPNKVSKTNFDGQVQVKEFKANGYLDKVTDNSNAYVSFSYYADGQVRATKINDQQHTEISYTYDTHRRKSTMSDPSLGSVVYNFDAFGNLRLENTNGKETSFDYDRLGRINKRTVDEGISIWYWDTEENGVGKLGSINYQPSKAPFIGFDEAFTYDEAGLVLTHTVSIDGQPKMFNYTYDELNRPKTKTWPTGFKTINYYDELSFLRYITDDNGTKLWEVETYNQWQNISQFKTGNQVQHNYTYNDINGRLESIKAAHQHHGTLQEFAYNWNPLTANLEERTDVLRSATESFGYDGFNRLTNITQNNNHTVWASYDHLGRIESKQDAGTYQYLPNRPYAVDNITDIHGDFPLNQQDIEYTSFNKVKNISEGDNELNIAYGPYSQRIWQQNTKADNNSRRQKYYFTPEYEIETNAENQEILRHYLLGPTGVFAIFTAMNDDQQMHYVLKDHQGSLTGLADTDGVLTESYSYDAFGRRRNAQNWSYDNITTSTITDRGYTFHEHLDEFGLINMNGRVYDPLIGHVLSPDPFIQQPENSQSYNRYGYVFNNPLRFTDPSGYFASGDTTGKQQNNAESIFIRQAREDQQKERLSYNTDESTDGPGVSQLQVEGDQAGGGDYAWAGVLAFAGTAAVADGPMPIGDAIGAATLAAYGSYVLADKMAAEISRIAEKVNNTRGFVYELRVNSPGTYVNVRGVPTQMNAGDVWRYGETTKGFGRYSQSTLDNMIPGGVSMVPIFQGNVVEIKIQEKIMIYGYSMMNGHLPPGNRIYR